MRFIIRADASSKIGTGHVMRCSAVAEELIRRGQKVVFVGHIEGLLWVQARVNFLGFSEIYSNPANFHSNPDSDVLILDSYEIDPLDPFIDSRKWRKVVALVDDTTPKFHANLYIHPGPGTTWLPPETEREVRIISGIEYIPIRRTFRNFQRRRLPGDLAVPKILIIGGGSDPYDFCRNMGTILHNLPEDFSATFFTNVGTLLPTDIRFKFVEIGPRLEDFLTDTDLVFSTAGTSSWEFLSRGFPVGLACAVDNQAANYRYQTEAHLVLGIGLRNNNQWELDGKAIKKLVTDPDCRNDLAERASHIVDGRGAIRIVDVIVGSLAP